MSWVVRNLELIELPYYAGGNGIDEDICWVESCEDAYKFNYKEYAEAFINAKLNRKCVTIKCKA